eukprot:SAG11_NODE_449_length_9392_cov_16.435381_9_plen_552_part_00
MADAGEQDPGRLIPWFESVGVSGVKLVTARAVCEDNEVECVADLRDMFETGGLDTAGFKGATLAKIKKALGGSAGLGLKKPEVKRLRKSLATPGGTSAASPSASPATRVKLAPATEPEPERAAGEADDATLALGAVEGHKGDGGDGGDKGLAAASGAAPAAATDDGATIARQAGDEGAAAAPSAAGAAAGGAPSTAGPAPSAFSGADGGGGDCGSDDTSEDRLVKRAREAAERAAAAEEAAAEAQEAAAEAEEHISKLKFLEKKGKSGNINVQQKHALAELKNQSGLTVPELVPAAAGTVHAVRDGGQKAPSMPPAAHYASSPQRANDASHVVTPAVEDVGGGTISTQPAVASATAPVDKTTAVDPDVQLSSFLKKAGLTKYKDALLELGTLFIEDMEELDESDFDTIGMNQIEIKRLRRFLKAHVPIAHTQDAQVLQAEAQQEERQLEWAERAEQDERRQEMADAEKISVPARRAQRRRARRPWGRARHRCRRRERPGGDQAAQRGRCRTRARGRTVDKPLAQHYRRLCGCTTGHDHTATFDGCRPSHRG